MSHRPYPNADRALRQIARHDDEWAPGGPFPPALDLPHGWDAPILPATVRLSPEQAEALRELPERLHRSIEAFKAGAVRSLSEMTRRMAAMQRPPVDEYRLSTR